MGLLDRILRVGDGKKLKALSGIIPDVNALEPEIHKLSDDALRAKTAEFRQRIERGEMLDDLLIDAFAVTRETALRTIGQRHFDVQIMGGAALHLGWVAEMKTGEGKTLVSTLPAYLNGLGGQGVHLVTVNDYLARRDAEWMGQIHKWLGLSVGLVIPGFKHTTPEKRAAYACDITYGTNNELGFDYLRDNMAARLADKAQRGHSYCIVDEVDSILIDEARTPLIISGRLADAAKLYYRFASIVRSLQRDEDYEVEEDKRVVVPLEAGIERVEQELGIENLYDEVQRNLVHQLQVALKAKELYRRDKDYIVQQGEVKIVDEFTGRILEGRRWSEGVHQAVEAKEGVKIKEENQTLATITLQNYFRLYDKLAGMTGTASTEAAELMNTYGLGVVPIPTNMPVGRVDQADLIYKNEDSKFEAIVRDIEERFEAGQPVLVGTVSVEKSEHLSRLLAQRGIDHEVLNAKQHTREAQIVAQAGRMRAVTVATNMAGRGVDILLGGNPESMARAEVLKEGFPPEALVDEFTLPAPLADMPEEYREIRIKALARYDELLSEFRESCSEDGDRVRGVGGVYVIGSERHESRRIDNQLRGRSGRQGDPGASRFYLSLDDELMRLFATGALSYVMNKTLPDDEAIEAKMVTKAIERAQTTVETRNAEIRKNVLKYDEVMDLQRKVIYAERRRVLEGEDLREQVHHMLTDVVTAYVNGATENGYAEDWDLDGLWRALKTLYPIRVHHEDIADEAGDLTRDVLLAAVLADAREAYARREAELAEQAGKNTMRQLERRVVLSVLDRKWREHLYEMDYLKEGIGLRAMAQRDPLVEYKREGFEMFSALLDGLKEESVSFLFNLQVQVVTQQPAAAPAPDRAPAPPDVPSPPTAPSPVGSAISQLDRVGDAPVVPAALGVHGLGASGLDAPAARPLTYSGPTENGGAEVRGRPGERRAGNGSAATVTGGQEPSRNAPCPCGSGRKYKHCHGAPTEAARF